MLARFVLTACLLMTGLISATSASARELRMAFEEAPATLDIHEQLSQSVLQLAHISFDPLVRWTRELSFEPRLATSFQRLDANTVRFHLRRGVKFHSGNTMTAEDFVWTFSRLKKSPDFSRIFANFVALKAVDSYTIDLVTNGPYPLVLNTATYIFPLDSKFYTGTDFNGKDKAAIVKNGASFASANLSGTGPFKLVARKQGGKLAFERFTDYWDKNSPGNVTSLEFAPIQDEQTRVEALLSGDVDFIAPVSPAYFDQIRASSNARLFTLPGTRIVTFQMNQQRRPEFRDQRVRMAIVHAIDNEAIVQQIMNGFATTAEQMSPPGYLGHNPNLKPRYDLELARKLMKDAGYADGFSITMMAPNNRYVNDEEIARAVAGMLAKINIEVDLKTIPTTLYWPMFDDRAADMMMIAWQSDTEDSANFYEFLAMTPDQATGFGSYNSGNYSSEYVDSQTIQASQETDPARRAEILQAIETQIFQDAAFVPLYWQSLAWAARKGVILDPIVNALDFPYLGDLVIE